MIEENLTLQDIREASSNYLRSVKDNRLTSDEYRELKFQVTYADLGRRVRHSEYRKIKLKLQNQLSILEGKEEPNK